MNSSRQMPSSADTIGTRWYQEPGERMTRAVATADFATTGCTDDRVARNASATGLPTGTARGSVTGSSLAAVALAPKPEVASTAKQCATLGLSNSSVRS